VRVEVEGVVLGESTNARVLSETGLPPWLILTFYVPALWVSVALVAWQLWTRRDERLCQPLSLTGARSHAP
jgi:hypothetical protein